MLRLGTWLAFVVALVGGLATSQAPEFAQQYRQRLNGALQELRQVVADFDADAARHQFDREGALAAYEQAGEPLLQDRARSMRRIFDRFSHLEYQSVRLGEVAPILRPFIILADPDPVVMEGAVGDYEPAVPVTAHGLVWGGSGFLAGLGLVRLIAFPFRRRRKHARAAGA